MGDPAHASRAAYQPLRMLPGPHGPTDPPSPTNMLTFHDHGTKDLFYTEGHRNEEIRFYHVQYEVDHNLASIDAGVVLHPREAIFRLGQGFLFCLPGEGRRAVVLSVVLASSLAWGNAG